MSIFDNVFQKIFGRQRNQTPNPEFEDHRYYGDRFRNPIWQMDDDEDDEVGDFRHPGSRNHFNIFTDPFQMTRYFESQIDGMLKDFFHGFGQGFGNAFGPSNDNASFLALAAPSPENLRDNFLKPGYDDPPPIGLNAPKSDFDLDGRLGADDLPKIFNKNCLEPIEPQLPQHFSFNIFKKSAKSAKRQVIRRADGAIEHKQTITDSDGNTETTVTRQIGDKIHTVKTKRDKNGAETKVEDFINMDENQLADFKKKWRPVVEPTIDPSTLD